MIIFWIAAELQPINVPYQTLPAYMEYATCVTDHVAGDPKARNADKAVVSKANSDALSACWEVRKAQLKRALELQTDTRTFGNSTAKTQAAVRAAFDRFDKDYEIELVK